MKKDYTRSNFIIFTCSVAMVIIITVLVFYFYKIDEASTVTVSNIVRQYIKQLITIIIHSFVSENHIHFILLY